MGTAIGEKAVAKAEGLAGMLYAVGANVGDGVAVAFVLFVVVEGFRVSKPDVCAFAAGDGEDGVGGGEGLAVEEDVEVEPGWTMVAGNVWVIAAAPFLGGDVISSPRTICPSN